MASERDADPEDLLTAIRLILAAAALAALVGCASTQEGNAPFGGFYGGVTGGGATHE